jgi:hypothetical protein
MSLSGSYLSNNSSAPSAPAVSLSLTKLPPVLARGALALFVAGTLAACGSGLDDLDSESNLALSGETSSTEFEHVPATSEIAGEAFARALEQTPVMAGPSLEGEADEAAEQPYLEEESAVSEGPEVKATATKLYATKFESPVRVDPVSLYRNADQYVEGQDVSSSRKAFDLWNTPEIYRGWILSVVGSSTPLKSSSYIENKIKTVTSRTGGSTRALSLNSKAKSPSTGVQQVALQNAYPGVEPVMYQRMWVKFDTDLLSRARSIGSRDFWQMFWEVKAEPDYRIRLQLQYSDSGGLYWQVQGDKLTSATPLWSSTLKNVPVKLASHSSASGWHKIEIWMNRPGGRFKAAIDGVVLVDRTGKLMGASGRKIDQFKMAMVYSNSPLTEMLVDDLEFWTSPPSDAWKKP